MALVFGVILLGLVFEYINGFHDTANAIATVVSTRVLLPRQAILMAAVCNLIGALMGTAVARRLAGGWWRRKALPCIRSSARWSRP